MVEQPVERLRDTIGLGPDVASVPRHPHLPVDLAGVQRRLRDVVCHRRDPFQGRIAERTTRSPTSAPMAATPAPITTTQSA